MTPWEIRTIEFANCNCAYGCPCQFNVYCGPVLRHPAEPIQAANFRSAVAF